MDFGISPDSVLRAYIHIASVREVIQWTIQDFVMLYPSLNNFATFDYQIKLLHKGILALLITIHQDPGALVQQGLRIGEESWENPPETAIAALDEVAHILICVEPLVNLRNGRLRVPNFHYLFETRLYSAFVAVESVYRMLVMQVCGLNGPSERQEPNLSGNAEGTNDQ